MRKKTDSAESVARGQELYRAVYMACHGEKGKDDGVQDQRDANGMPTRPRDFTRGIFKGGRETERLYTRIRFGMPGTPMPGSPQYTPTQLGDLVNFILTLSDPSSQKRVEHKRTRLVAKRSPKPMSSDDSDVTGSAVEASPIVVSPLWWRNYDEPEPRSASGAANAEKKRAAPWGKPPRRGGARGATRNAAPPRAPAARPAENTWRRSGFRPAVQICVSGRSICQSCHFLRRCACWPKWNRSKTEIAASQGVAALAALRPSWPKWTDRILSVSGCQMIWRRSDFTKLYAGAVPIT